MKQITELSIPEAFEYITQCIEQYADGLLYDHEALNAILGAISPHIWADVKPDGRIIVSVKYPDAGAGI